MPTSATQFSLWIEWAKALGPALAVLVSAFAVVVSVLTFRLSRQIARWQVSVTRAQFRQNVYDRRFRIYEAAKTLLVMQQRNGNLSPDDYITYRRGIADAVFLLVDASVIAYLEQLREQAERLLRLNNQIRETGSGEDEAAEIENWFQQQFDILVSKFKPSMRLDEP